MKSAGDDTALNALAGQLISLLSAPAREELMLACSTPAGVALSALSDDTLLQFERYLPRLIKTDQRRGRLYVPEERLREALSLSLRAHDDAKEATDIVHLIRQAILEDRTDEALLEFDRAGGIFFALLHGVETARRIVDTFPEAVRASSEQLILANIFNTMKSADVAHARRLFDEYVGPAFDDIDKILEPGAFSDDVMYCRLCFALFEEEVLPQSAVEALFRIAQEAPQGASLQKGVLYNVAVGVFTERRQWATAEETARLAKYHFSNARATLAAFYIDIFFVLIEFARGRFDVVKLYLAEARQALEQEGRQATNDMRLLAAFEHISEYEQGNSAPLTRFLLSDLDHDWFDEVSSSQGWTFIVIGSLAMAATVTLSAARAYIDRWRIQQWQSQRFASAVQLADIQVLQFHGRWLEADELLTELTHTTGDAYLRSVIPSLSDICENQQIHTAMRWCRSILETSPKSELLRDALSQLGGNAALDSRERSALLLWASLAAINREDWPVLLASMAELVSLARLSPIAVRLKEQREVFATIIANRTAMRRLSTSAKIATFVRENRNIMSEPAAGDHKLTRQEARMINLLAEQVPNKVIARRLGLSVPTVRFHQKNLYKKLGAANRRAALDIAIAEGILSA